VRYNDPSSVKLQKLAIITQLATPASMVDILLELSEYVTDMDVDISRFAVRSIGAIAIRLPEAAEEAIEHLLAFLEIKVPHVTSETVIVLKDFLRKVQAHTGGHMQHVSARGVRLTCMWCIACASVPRPLRGHHSPADARAALHRRARGQAVMHLDGEA